MGNGSTGHPRTSNVEGQNSAEKKLQLIPHKGVWGDHFFDDIFRVTKGLGRGSTGKTKGIHFRAHAAFGTASNAELPDEECEPDDNDYAHYAAFTAAEGPHEYEDVQDQIQGLIIKCEEEWREHFSPYLKVPLEAAARYASQKDAARALFRDMENTPISSQIKEVLRNIQNVSKQ